MTTTTIARAWMISRSDGLKLGFTDHDRPLEFAGVAFRPESGMSAGAIVQAVGLSVDNSEVEGALSDDAITETDLMAGRWDGAELLMWEVDWTDAAKRRLIFRGTLGDVSRKGGAFRAELRGLSEPLNRPGGRVYHPRCSARLGDAACGMNLSGEQFSTETVIGKVEDSRVFRFTTTREFQPRWFENGILQILAGDAAGLNATIKNDRIVENTTREIETWTSLNADARPGDRVKLTAGCDKSAANCRIKFKNYLNFRGFPHLPSEDWVTAPQAGQRRRDVQRTQPDLLEVLQGGGDGD